jgi:hypothetical protein
MQQLRHRFVFHARRLPSWTDGLDRNIEKIGNAGNAAVGPLRCFARVAFPGFMVASCCLLLYWWCCRLLSCCFAVAVSNGSQQRNASPANPIHCPPCLDVPCSPRKVTFHGRGFGQAARCVFGLDFRGSRLGDNEAANDKHRLFLGRHFATLRP